MTSKKELEEIERRLLKNRRIVTYIEYFLFGIFLNNIGKLGIDFTTSDWITGCIKVGIFRFGIPLLAIKVSKWLHRLGEYIIHSKKHKNKRNIFYAICRLLILGAGIFVLCGFFADIYNTLVDPLNKINVVQWFKNIF